MDQSKALTRRGFVKTASTAAVAPLILPVSAFSRISFSAKRHYAVIGTGERSVSMWTRPLVQNFTDVLEIVGLCDINAKRVAAARKMSGATCPTFTNFDQMCDQAKPDLLMVTTVAVLGARRGHPLLKTLDESLLGGPVIFIPLSHLVPVLRIPSAIVLALILLRIVWKIVRLGRR